MSKGNQTKLALLNAARGLFWVRGYSNVSLRDITAVVGVDVALVSRYFGSKMGLFQATLDGIYDWPELFDARDPDVAKIVLDRLMADGDAPSVLNMLTVNVTDPVVAELIQADFKTNLVDPLDKIIGSAWSNERAQMFLGSIFGMAMMRQSFGLNSASQDQFDNQAQHLMRNALRYIA